MQPSARLGLLLVLTLTTPAGAQQAPPVIAGPAPSILLAAANGPLRQPLVLDSVPRDIRPTHWKKGALIGGVVTGLGLALLLDGFCTADSNCTGSTVPQVLIVGGIFGGLVGALIGGQFPKEEG